MDTDDTAMPAESPDTEVVVPSSTEAERVELARSAESGMPDTQAENHRPLSRSLVGLLVAVGVSAVGLGAFVFGEDVSDQ